jgi:hypothetical protein
MNKDTIGALLFAAGLCTTVLVNPAKATTDIVLGDSTLSAFPPPASTPFYGTFDVALITSTTATVTYSSNTFFPYYMTSIGAVGFNVNASSWSVSSVSGNCGGCALTESGPVTEGIFGSFNDGINSSFSTPFVGLASGLTSALSFTLTDLSGTWANAASVLTDNSSGFLVAEHLGVCNSGDTECQQTTTAYMATGFAAFGTPVTTTPLPAALPLFATGIGGLGLLGWRRKRKAQAV